MQFQKRIGVYALKVIMSGTDFSIASIDIREAIAPNKSEIGCICKSISEKENISGAVIISTCNRIEIYITACDGYDRNITPAELYCNEIGISYSKYKKYFNTLVGKPAITHIFEVSCGLKSLIIGEDQINGQVNDAIFSSREYGASDSILEALFSRAVSAGKEAKSKVKIYSTPLSAASAAIEMAENKLGSLKNKRALVIGNGKMGRLAAETLVNKQCNTTVTLRTYRHGNTVVPAGCNAVPYDKRIENASICDLVVSATSSPHYTITANDILNMTKKPLFVDIALPRDIEHCDYAEIINIDDIAYTNTDSDIEKIKNIVLENREKFYQWLNYKISLPSIESIKEAVFERIVNSTEFKEIQNDSCLSAKYCSEKAVELVLGGLKDILRPEAVSRCANKISERTRY